MKNDARLLLNRKKWQSGSGIRKVESWKTRDFQSRGPLDARKILNLKRSKNKTPVLGSYMRTKTATAFIASQIRKEISVSKVPEKRVEMSRDGNIIVTSKSKNLSRVKERMNISDEMDVDQLPKSRSLQMAGLPFESSSDMDDLEHTALEDLLDLESLPPAYVSSKSNTNLSRKSLVSQVLEKKNTMVADQLAQTSRPRSAKVFVSNLHPSVSKQDVMELFGDVGPIKNAEMLMPGTSVIDFYDMNDAEKACDIYHNRLLDGLPMICYMQSTSQSQRSTISQRLGDRIVSPPASKVISSHVTSNSRSRYNPRNVQFTVKLN